MRLVCLALLTLLAASAKAAQPNFVVVFIDDMGWGDFSCFGNKEISTPNFDRMAAEGICFTQFYVNSPICSPSRCALTTGRYPQRWRISSYLDNHAVNERRGVADWLDPEAPTLARMLQSAGYATGHFGKWHLGGQRDVDQAPAIQRYGFEASLTNFEGMGPKLLPLTLKPGEQKPGRIWADAERLGGPVTWMQRSEITTGFANAAKQFIDKASAEGRPFYVNLWPDDVHSPFWPPVADWSKGKRPMYLAVLKALDRQLGVFFDHLRSTPKLRDNTLVLICSDNGPEPEAGSAGPFRGSKTTLYEGGIRSPLIVWGPGLQAQAKAGTSDEASVFAAFDLPPSLLAIAGVKPAGDAAFDGEDISPALLGHKASSRSEPLFWRRPPDRKTWAPKVTIPQPDLAMRDGPWKLLCDYDGSAAKLYHLANDPGETQDLAASQSERVTRMTQAVVEWHGSLPKDNGQALGEEQTR